MSNTLWSQSELQMCKDTRTSGKFSKGPERLEAWHLGIVTARKEWSWDPSSESIYSCALDRPFPSEGNKGQMKALIWDCCGRICSSVRVDGMAVELSKTQAGC